MWSRRRGARDKPAILEQSKRDKNSHTDQRDRVGRTFGSTPWLGPHQRSEPANSVTFDLSAFACVCICGSTTIYVQNKRMCSPG